MTPFATYLRRLQRKHYKRVGDFAEALGVNITHLCRAMGANSRPFDIYGLFRLAEVTGESIDTVLRKAGKRDLADRIIAHYGEPPPPRAPIAREMQELTEQLLQRGSADDVKHLHRLLQWLVVTRPAPQKER